MIHQILSLPFSRILPVFILVMLTPILFGPQLAQSYITGSDIVLLSINYDTFDSESSNTNDFHATKGTFNSSYITTQFVTDNVVDGSGFALQVTYDLPLYSYAGIWESQFGHIDDDIRYLDYSKGFEELHFWVRGSGNSTSVHNLKVELKDVNGEYYETAYVYVPIDDSDTTWREIVLDADVTNDEFWSYNGSPPDLTRMKELVFVLERTHNNPTGTFYIDNIHFVVTQPEPVNGLPYVFADFNTGQIDTNGFQGNWGELIAEYVSTGFSDEVFVGSWGYSLEIEHNLEANQFTGIWQSLWGHSDYPQYTLNINDIYGTLNEPDKGFEQIRFWVRGSGQTTGNHIVKVELKDVSGEYNRTAYRYIYIDDSDTNWREVVLDIDVTNANFWSYNDLPPDPSQMKEFVFVLESDLNDPDGGTFYIDDIRFVDADDQPFDTETHTSDEFLDLISKTTFLTMLDLYDEQTGLCRDRSSFPDLFSTASTGFCLTSLIVGEERGWIDRTDAMAMAEVTLQTLWDYQTSDPLVTNGWHGYFYHFLDEDGFRKNDSELSSVDSAILLFGVISVREHFNDNANIVALADQIYDRVEWDWMLNDDNLFFLGWKPECNDTDYQIPASDGGCFTSFPDGSPLDWDIYTDEVILINLLAVGSETHPVSRDVFYAWWRNWEPYGGHTAVESWNGSFFTYVFAHLWIDFASLGEDMHPDPEFRVDWWENSVQAALANYQFARDHEDDVPCDGDDDYTTYNWPVFGATAADGPNGYKANGFEPSALEPPYHDGTIAPYGAGSAIMFIPDKSLTALLHFFNETDLWRYRFGFADAYNLDPPDCGQPWYNHVAFGIDNGPLLLAIENYRSGFVWETVKQNTQIQAAIQAIWLPNKTYLPVVTYVEKH